MKPQHQIKKELKDKALNIIKVAGYEPDEEVPLKVKDKVVPKKKVIHSKRYKDYTGKDPEFFNERPKTYRKKS